MNILIILHLIVGVILGLYFVLRDIFLMMSSISIVSSLFLVFCSFEIKLPTIFANLNATYRAITSRMRAEHFKVIMMIIIIMMMMVLSNFLNVDECKTKYLEFHEFHAFIVFSVQSYHNH